MNAQAISRYFQVFNYFWVDADFFFEILYSDFLLRS